jgi:DNA processing protein
MDLVALQLLLGRAVGLSAAQLLAALERTGAQQEGLAGFEALIGASPAALADLGFRPTTSHWLHAPDMRLIDADRAWAARGAVRLIDATSRAYPGALARAGAAPPLLYVQGEPGCLAHAQLAIVGTRQPSAPGRANAAHFAAGLVRAGLTVTSGLALGIDAAGHEGALAASGRTVAVLGSALDRLYPRQCGALAARIAVQGALVSQFPPGTPPCRSNFPQRNRVISGLCLGTLVVEATRGSGSLITAGMTARAGRPVFAIPGSIHNPMAHGCHALIRAGARLVESVDDILRELHLDVEKQVVATDLDPDRKDSREPPMLDKVSEILLDAMGFEPASVDALVERTGLPSQSVASKLLILELEGAVEPQAGGFYVCLQARRRRCWS